MTHLIYAIIIATQLGLTIFVIDIQEDRITELEYDLNVSQIVLKMQSDQIGKRGLCSPRDTTRAIQRTLLPSMKG